MHVINSLASELVLLPEPGKPHLVTHGLLAAVFLPTNVRLGPQYAGAFLAAGQVLGHEGTDIESHTVVDVRLPADRLFLDRLPADEEVERGFAFHDGNEPLL